MSRSFLSSIGRERPTLTPSFLPVSLPDMTRKIVSLQQLFSFLDRIISKRSVVLSGSHPWRAIQFLDHYQPLYRPRQPCSRCSSRNSSRQSVKSAHRHGRSRENICKPFKTSIVLGRPTLAYIGHTRYKPIVCSLNRSINTVYMISYIRPRWTSPTSSTSLRPSASLFPLTPLLPHPSLFRRCINSNCIYVRVRIKPTRLIVLSESDDLLGILPRLFFLSFSFFLSLSLSLSLLF